MRKYVAIFVAVAVVLIAAIELAACHVSQPTERIVSIDGHQITLAPMSSVGDKHSSNDVKSEPPCWHKLLSWPEGITAWAILLTLGAIIWQAWETRRSVQVGLRPRLIIRRVCLNIGTQIPVFGVPDTRPQTVEFEIANIGGSTARVTNGRFMISVFKQEFPPKTMRPQGTGFAPFSLEAGEYRGMSVRIEDNLANLFRTIGVRGPNMAHQDTGHVYFWGNAQYRDALGIARNIAVCRHYESDTGNFKAMDDPDREYAD